MTIFGIQLQMQVFATLTQKHLDVMFSSSPKKGHQLDREKNAMMKLCHGESLAKRPHLTEKSPLKET